MFRELERMGEKKTATQQTFVDLQDMLKTSSRHVMFTQDAFMSSTKIRSCYAEDIFKMLSRRLQDMSGGRLLVNLETNKIFSGKESISISKKYKSGSDKFLFNKPMSDKSKANPKQIYDALTRIQ